jgi:hypothetical protein
MHVFRGYSVGGRRLPVQAVQPEILQSKVAVFVELFHKREALKRQTQALLHAHDELEDRCARGPASSPRPNQSLRDEVDERKRIEADGWRSLESEQTRPGHAER